MAAALAWPAAAGAMKPVKIGDFHYPVYVTAPAHEPKRLFVVQLDGRIVLLHGGLRRNFLDVGPKLAHAAGEQGLYSLAFAPDYATSGRFYVYYTAPRPGDPHGDVLTVAEYRRSAAHPDRADPKSARVVLRIDHPGHVEHNGGQIAFGPDRLLYLGTGDGGLGEGQNAQDPRSLLGKMLRFDPRERHPKPEVYATGLRNPWRFSFDRKTGDLVIGDVGQSIREEVDFSPRGTPGGRNYGWDCREGFRRWSGTCMPGPLTDPIFDYPHAGRQGCTGAITGGYVVRSHDLDSLYGRYVYVDFCRAAWGGDVRSLVVHQPRAEDDRSTGFVDYYVAGFGEDSCGHLYVTSLAGEVDALVDRALTPCRDRTPPRLTVARKYRQHLDPQRSLVADVRCDERCRVVGRARIHVPGHQRAFELSRALPWLPAGERATLRLRLSDRAARAIRRALQAGNRVHATVTLTARDAAGNGTAKTRRIRLLP